jgi:hypothetical protein
MKMEDPTAMEDFLSEKQQFVFEKGDKKSPVKVYSYTSEDGKMRIERSFSKKKEENLLLVETKEKAFFESIQKGAKQSAFKIVKGTTGPIIKMDNHIYTYDFEPAESEEGGIHRIKLYPSVKKK